MRTTEYHISGMSCAACSASVERVTRRVAGVENAVVNLATERLRVRGDVYTDEAIRKAVEKAGFSASPIEDKRLQTERDRVARQAAIRKQKRRAAVALVFAALLLYLAMGPMIGLPAPISMHETPLLYALAQFALLVPIAVCGRHFFTRGFKALLHLSPNMDTLVSVGTLSAMAYSAISTAAIARGDASAVHRLYFESAGVILALVLFGKTLEARSKMKTADAILNLMNLTPSTAHVLRDDGTSVDLPADSLMISDTVAVLPGERVPVDGEILTGHPAIDESLLTGESMPVEKQPGERVTGGSINGASRFVFRALRVGDDTTLAQMIRMVEDAQTGRADVSRLADRVSAVFVPVVAGIAFAAACVWLIAGESVDFALTVFVSVLVIACPCALGLATPTAIMVGTGIAAKRGILFKSGEALEHAQSLRAVAFDKTGTVTKGRPAVTDVEAVGDEAAFLKLFASVEQGSEHPLAHAILDHAAQAGITPDPAESFEAVPGRGARAVINGCTVLAGNGAFLVESGVEIPDTAARYAAAGKTPMLLASGGTYRGVIAVADEIRPDSTEAVARLRSMGLFCALLTGDNETTARAIGQSAGFDAVYAQLLPADKLDRIRKLNSTHGPVAMVGDGVNDAPALALADVGMAVGSGTDVSIASADVVLMHDSLAGVAEAIGISRDTMRIIRENLFWAFFYNIVGIPVAAGLLYAFGGPLLSPMLAAFAMSFSSVTVLANTLRLKRVAARKAK